MIDWLKREYARAPRLYALTFVIAASFLAYANTLEAGFHFDDSHHIVGNEALRDAGNIPRYFTRPDMFSSLPHHRMYRPVLLASFALNHFMGGYDPFWWRLTAIALHALVAAGVFLLVRSLSATLDQRAGGGGDRGALVAALLFAVHPVFTETVDYASARSSLLATAGVVWAMIAHRAALASTAPLRRYGLGAHSLLLFVLGFLSKEIAVVYPLLLGVVAWLERRDLRWVLPAIGTAAVLLIVRKVVLGSAVIDFVAREAGVARAKEGTGAARPMLWNLWTQSRVVLAYVGLFLVPVGLCIHRSVRVSESAFEPGVLGSTVALAAVLVVAWRGRRTRPLLSLGLLWFLVSLAPTSSIIPLNQVMNEHRLYLPGVGAAIVLAFAVPRLRFATAPVWAAVGLSLLVLTWQRNRDWSDPVRIWASATRVSPQSDGAWNSLGSELRNRGEFAKARHAFERCVELRPRSWEGNFNLGTLCLQLARADADPMLLAEAEARLKQSLVATPKAARSRWYLAEVWYRQGDNGRAENEFRRLATRSRKMFEMTRFPLARLALERGDEAEARRLYREAAGHSYDPAAARERLADLEKRASAPGEK